MAVFWGWISGRGETSPQPAPYRRGENLPFRVLQQGEINERFAELRVRFEMIRNALPERSLPWRDGLRFGPEAGDGGDAQGPEVGLGQLGRLKWRNDHEPELMRFRWPPDQKSGRPETIGYWYFGLGFNGFIDFSDHTARRIVNSVRAALVKAEEREERRIARLWLFASRMRQVGVTPVSKTELMERAQRTNATVNYEELSAVLRREHAAAGWYRGKLAVFELRRSSLSSEVSDYELAANPLEFDIPAPTASDPEQQIVIGVHRAPSMLGGVQTGEILWKGQSHPDAARPRLRSDPWREAAEARDVEKFASYNDEILKFDDGSFASAEDARAAEASYERRRVLMWREVFPLSSTASSTDLRASGAEAHQLFEALQYCCDDFQPPEGDMAYAQALASGKEQFEAVRLAWEATDRAPGDEKSGRFGEIEIWSKPILALPHHDVYELIDRRGGFVRRTPLLFARNMTDEIVAAAKRAFCTKTPTRWPDSSLKLNFNGSPTPSSEGDGDLLVDAIGNPQIVPLVDRRDPIELLCLLFPPDFAEGEHEIPGRGEKRRFTRQDKLKNYAHFFGKYAARADGYFNVLEGREDLVPLDRQRNGRKRALSAARHLRFLRSARAMDDGPWSLSGGVVFNRDVYHAIAQVHKDGFTRIERHQRIVQKLDIAPSRLTPETHAFLRKPCSMEEAARRKSHDAGGGND